MGGVSELLAGEMIQVVQLIKPHTFFQTLKRKVLLVVKDQTAKAGDTTDTGSIPWWERSLGEGNGNSLQYSCLENPMDREPGGFHSMGHKESDMSGRLNTKPRSSQSVSSVIKLVFRLKYMQGGCVKG